MAKLMITISFFLALILLGSAENMMHEAAEAKRDADKICEKIWPCKTDIQCRDDCQRLYDGDGWCDFHKVPYIPQNCTCTYEC
ncbi:hypothetical protein AB3S75_012440 [Citrus x aurantiifolia]